MQARQQTRGEILRALLRCNFDSIEIVEVAPLEALRRTPETVSTPEIKSREALKRKGTK